MARLRINFEFLCLFVPDPDGLSSDPKHNPHYVLLPYLQNHGFPGVDPHFAILRWDKRNQKALKPGEVAKPATHKVNGKSTVATDLDFEQLEIDLEGSTHPSDLKCSYDKRLLHFAKGKLSIDKVNKKWLKGNKNGPKPELAARIRLDTGTLDIRGATAGCFKLNKRKKNGTVVENLWHGHLARTLQWTSPKFDKQAHLVFKGLDGSGTEKHIRLEPETGEDTVEITIRNCENEAILDPSLPSAGSIANPSLGAKDRELQAYYQLMNGYKGPNQHDILELIPTACMGNGACAPAQCGC